MNEYRVKPVTRWVVTRYTGSGVDTLGEFDSERFAKEVREALERVEKPEPLPFV